MTTEKKKREMTRRMVNEPSSFMTSLIILISGLNEGKILRMKKPLIRIKLVLTKLIVFILARVALS